MGLAARPGGEHCTAARLACGARRCITTGVRARSERMHRHAKGVLVVLVALLLAGLEGAQPRAARGLQHSVRAAAFSPVPPRSPRRERRPACAESCDGNVPRLGSGSASQARRREPELRGGGAEEGNAAGPAFSRVRDGRRGWLLRAAVAAIVGGLAGGGQNAAGALERVEGKRSYFQRFPTLFAPLYGAASKATIRREVGRNVWALEQNLELGPLETPLRCVVIRLDDGTLWVHAPLAPTEEFFELVESCAHGPESIAHVVVPTYALEHKVFAKDALRRWPNARLWTAPGQFSFPVRSVPDEYVWGRSVSGVLRDSDEAMSTSQIPWIDQIEYETLTAGTFSLGLSPVTFYETAFYHKASRSLIVTDALAQVQLETPELNDPAKLLLISKRSTADELPEDTASARQIGWEKTALLVSYFFPEHEELDPDRAGVVTWTEGWHDNFKALAGRLIVPPVVRTLIYAQNPARVRDWVDRVSARWDFEQIVPAHFQAPIQASPREFSRAFAFLDDDSSDAFPAKDLARGLKPIADIFVRKERSEK